MAGTAGAAVATTDWPYKKVTLIKPLVGRVRTPSFALPASPSHVYGARVQKDNETAATLLSNWTTTATAPSSACNSTGNATLAAPQSRNLTARAQREFAKRHPGITVPLKRVVGSSREQQYAGGAGPPEPSPRAKALAASGFVFGLATPRNAETLGDVIGARFTPGLLEQEPDYPGGGIVAVLAAIERRRKQEEAERTGVPVGGKLWTMPRWAKARATVTMKNSGAA